MEEREVYDVMVRNKKYFSLLTVIMNCCKEKQSNK